MITMKPWKDPVDEAFKKMMLARAARAAAFAAEQAAFNKRLAKDRALDKREVAFAEAIIKREKERAMYGN